MLIQCHSYLITLQGQPHVQRRKRRTVSGEDEDYYDLSGTGTSSDHHSRESEWEDQEWDGENNDSDAADDMSLQLPTEMYRINHSLMKHLLHHLRKMKINCFHGL